MEALGVTLLFIGTWLTYAGVKNVAPIATLKNIIQNPGKARQVIGENLIDPGANPATVSTTVSNTTGGSSAIVDYARKMIGKPYRLGGNGSDNTFDCSGLVQKSLESIGVKVPHSATGIYFSTLGKPVPNVSLANLSNLKPGDIVFPYAPVLGDVSHVGIYSGNGNFIEAAHPGTNVREVKLYSLFSAKRFTA